MSEFKVWGDYPAAAEAFWLDQVERATGRIGDEALEKITPAVGRLSDLFTTERPKHKFPEYFADPELLAGYGIFFLPQSFIRTSFALAHAYELRQWRPAFGEISILDLGSGPGSCGVAAAHCLAQLTDAKITLTAVDRSPMALVAAEGFAHATLGARVSVRSRVGDAARSETWPEGSYDIIVAGFVMNEMTQLDPTNLLAWVDQLKAHLNPGGLILILEPALRVTAQRLQRLSDEVSAQGVLTRIGSDLDDDVCAQLLGAEHWNHEARAWKTPDSTDFVNRRLHRDLRDIKYAFAAFTSATVAPLPAQCARLVSDVQIIKGLLRFITVRQGLIEAVEVPTRGLSKHEVKKLAAQFGRGDVVRHDQPPAAKIRLAKSGDFEVFWSPR